MVIVKLGEHAICYSSFLLMRSRIHFTLPAILERFEVASRSIRGAGKNVRVDDETPSIGPPTISSRPPVCLPLITLHALPQRILHFIWAD